MRGFSRLILIAILILNLLTLFNLVSFTINKANAGDDGGGSHAICQLCVYQGGSYLECTHADYGWPACIQGPNYCEHTGDGGDCEGPGPEN